MQLCLLLSSVLMEELNEVISASQHLEGLFVLLFEYVPVHLTVLTTNDSSIHV